MICTTVSGETPRKQEDINWQTKPYEREGGRFCAAIRDLASNPVNLENLESYLGSHFDKWLSEFATTPEDLCNELESFARIEFN